MTPSFRALLLSLSLLSASLTAIVQQAPLPGQMPLRLAQDNDAARIEQQVAGTLPEGVHVQEFVTLGEGARRASSDLQGRQAKRSYSAAEAH
jgi:hypothetical protein